MNLGSELVHNHEFYMVLDRESSIHTIARLHALIKVIYDRARAHMLN